jgi:hypothetical protein
MRFIDDFLVFVGNKLGETVILHVNILAQSKIITNNIRQLDNIFKKIA